MIRNERGYALILVLFMVLILTILGTTVLSASIGGALRSETRENDVQSLHLAEKTLNEAVAYLYAEFDGQDAITPEDVEDKINHMNIRFGLGTKNVHSELGVHAEGTITNVDVHKERANNTGDEVIYNIELEAEALVNGVKRTLVQKVRLDSYPEFLKYAFGSENNVYINGGLFTRGDVYAGDHLYIQDVANYTYKTIANSEPSVFLDIEGNVFIPNRSNIEYLKSPMEPPYIPFNNSSGITSEELMGITVNQIKIREKKKFIAINVEETFIDKITEATGSRNDRNAIKIAYDNNTLATKLADYGATFDIIEQPTIPVPPTTDDQEDIDRYNTEISDYARYMAYFAEGRELSKSVVHQGDLTLDGITNSFAQLTYSDSAKNNTDPITNKSNWFIVDGDLNIHNYNSDETVIMPIKGNILVTGNVSITGNVQFDATIYSKGSTTVEDAQIRGLNGRELVLISLGQVLINRVDKFQEINDNYLESDKKTLKAFFYTDKSATLYGVGSAFWLHGGFFAKQDLIINAVRGNVSEPTDGSSFLLFNKSLENKKSRFIVDYNREIFEHQNIGLPRVKQVSVFVGQRKLQ